MSDGIKNNKDSRIDLRKMNSYDFMGGYLMLISLLESIFFVISLCALFWNVFMIKKTDSALNGTVWGIVSLVTVMTLGAFVMGLINIVKIPVNILTVSIVYVVLAIFINRLINKNEKQKYYWEKYDFIVCLVYFAAVVALGWYYFSPELRLMYFNSDAAVHFTAASTLARTGELKDMYFATLQNALGIQIFKPFIKEVYWYKVYILGDLFMLWLEGVFFMAVIRDYLKNKGMKVAGFIIGILYYMGYPLNNFLFAFLYWGEGVMIIAYIMFMLRCFKNREFNRKFSSFALMLGFGTITITYMIFGPIAYIGAFIYLAIVLKQEGKLISLSNITLMLKLYLLPCFISVYYSLFDYLTNVELSADAILAIEGGCYRELFFDFIWTMPFVLYAIIRAVKKKKADENIVFFALFLAITAVMFIIVYKGKISPYYYYKLYYPLWFLAFIIAVQAVNELMKRAKEIVISVGIIFFALAIYSFGKIEAKIVASPYNISGYERVGNLYNLYSFNSEMVKWKTEKFGDEMFELFEYIMEEYDYEEETIPFISTIDRYEQTFWYQGITGHNCKGYYGWEYTFEQLVDRLNDGSISHYVIMKSSDIYKEHKKYFKSLNIEYENKKGVVVSVGV